MNEKAVFINITEMRAGNVEPVYKIRACNEECYIVEEKEVQYIESCHNQVLWHCTNGIISSNNSLGNLEEQVSDAFVRILQSGQYALWIKRNRFICCNRKEWNLLHDKGARI